MIFLATLNFMALALDVEKRHVACAQACRNGGLLQSLLLVRYCELGTALSPSARKHIPAIFGRHALLVTVLVYTLAIGRLIRSFHDTIILICLYNN